MSIIPIVITLFILIESVNVLTLYFNPGSKQANGLGVFDAWEKSKADPEVHQLVRYLVYWVAGVKLIFISLLVVILFQADETTYIFTLLAMIASIASFFWRLYPIMKSLDKEHHISPSGYSRQLGTMIAGFIVVFAAVLLWALFTQFA